VPVVGCESVKHALKRARQADADCLVLDARGFADAQTLEVARAADALLVPSGLAVDDLLPAVRLAHELTRAGVPRARIGMALCRTGDAPGEIAEAARYIGEAGYHCLSAAWPERAGYRRAHDEGRVATEARHPSLQGKARAFSASAVAFIEAQASLKKEGRHASSRE
jgi:chromosome partitioning protein